MSQDRELHEQTQARLNNLNALEGLGFAPHPYSYPTTASSAEVLAAHAGEPGTRWEGQTYALAGRLMLLRNMGKAAFADLQDEAGKIQIYFSQKDLERFDAVSHLDLGDVIGVKGFPFVTKTGQLTLSVTEFTPLVKSLHPLPDKFHGLKDPELRSRSKFRLTFAGFVPPFLTIRETMVR